jgi:hypothetical protein
MNALLRRDPGLGKLLAEQIPNSYSRRALLLRLSPNLPVKSPVKSMRNSSLQSRRIADLGPSAPAAARVAEYFRSPLRSATLWPDLPRFRLASGSQLVCPGLGTKHSLPAAQRLRVAPKSRNCSRAGLPGCSSAAHSLTLHISARCSLAVHSSPLQVEARLWVRQYSSKQPPD